jgi:hypothetical protein
VNPARAQRGQVLVLVALLMAVLAGFLGLVIDGGGVAAEQQLVRNAADGAALAGGYAIFRQSSTEAAATTAAQKVLIADSLSSGDLAISFLDSGGSPTAALALVRTVQATVTDSRRTTFLALLGLASTQISATAEVAGTASTVAACALCSMSSAPTGISIGNNAHLTVTGAGLIVNSTANPNLSVGSGGSLSAPSIVEVVNRVSNSGTITPAPTLGSATGDPHAGLTAPSLAGSAVAYTAPIGSPSIGPGIYSSISVNSGSTLTLSAGTYVLTGPLNVTGGSLTGAGVTIYLACPGYPTACAGGTSGAAMNLTGGATTLSPPLTGTYAGLTVFADRNNNAATTISQAALTVTGTWYSIAMPIHDLHPSDSFGFGELDTAAVTLSNNSVMTVAYVQAQSYGGGTTNGPLNLSL